MEFRETNRLRRSMLTACYDSEHIGFFWTDTGADGFVIDRIEVGLRFVSETGYSPEKFLAAIEICEQCDDLLEVSDEGEGGGVCDYIYLYRSPERYVKPKKEKEGDREIDGGEGGDAGEDGSPRQ